MREKRKVYLRMRTKSRLDNVKKNAGVVKANVYFITLQIRLIKSHQWMLMKGEILMGYKI